MQFLDLLSYYQYYSDPAAATQLKLPAEARHCGRSDLISKRGVCHTAKLGALQGGDVAHFMALSAAQLWSLVDDGCVQRV